MGKPKHFSGLASDLLKRHKIGKQISNSMIVSKIQMRVNEENQKSLPIEITSFNEYTLKVTVPHPAMKNYARTLVERLMIEFNIDTVKEIIVQTGDLRHDKLYSEI